jgi:hypothetical protein
MSIVVGATLDSIVLAMDRKRTFDLSNYLSQVNDSTEIVIALSAKEAPKNSGSKPLFEVKYGMKEENLH